MHCVKLDLKAQRDEVELRSGGGSLATQGKPCDGLPCRIGGVENSGAACDRVGAGLTAGRLRAGCGTMRPLCDAASRTCLCRAAEPRRPSLPAPAPFARRRKTRDAHEGAEPRAGCRPAVLGGCVQRPRREAPFA